MDQLRNSDLWDELCKSNELNEFGELDEFNELLEWHKLVKLDIKTKTYLLLDHIFLHFYNVCFATGRNHFLPFFTESGVTSK